MTDWARRFYKSDPWLAVRAFVIARDKYVCQLCKGVIIGSPHVHHIIELTEENHTNPEISLNPELLETLHHDCHDERHGRFGHRPKETIVGADLNIDYKRR